MACKNSFLRGQEAAATLRSEGLPTQVTLVRPLAAVDTQVYVQVVFLGEGVAAQAAHERPLVSVNGKRSGSHVPRGARGQWADLATCGWL